MQTKGLSRYGGPPGGNPTNLLSNRLLQAKKDQQSSIKNIAQEVVTAPEVVRPASPAQSITATSVVTSVINPPGGKRVRGQPQVIQRTIFYQGAVYVIEEEMYSDSDNSSVYTSEDEFDDDPQIVGKFLDKLDEYNEVKAYEAEQERIRKLNPVLTEKQKRLQKLGLSDGTQKELTPAQQEYRTKIWPKHYIPSVKEFKAAQLDLVGRQLDIEIGGIKNPGTRR